MVHQLKFESKSFLKIFTPLTEYYNNYYFNNFDRIIIPDNQSEKISLSWKLSQATIPDLQKKIYYSGILCSIKSADRKKDMKDISDAEDICDIDEIDVLISISGPEPHRRNLEGIIMKQILKVGGNKIVLLGKPGNHGNEFDYMLDENTRIISYADRNNMTELMNRSKVIISRSGYTTVMELANIGHKKALFIPTPGCLEQEYLAKRYMEKGWFLSKAQSEVNLVHDLNQFDKYTGFPNMPKSEDNVKKLYAMIISKYL